MARLIRIQEKMFLTQTCFYTFSKADSREVSEYRCFVHRRRLLHTEIVNCSLGVTLTFLTFITRTAAVAAGLSGEVGGELNCAHQASYELVVAAWGHVGAYCGSIMLNHTPTRNIHRDYA